MPKRIAFVVKAAPLIEQYPALPIDISGIEKLRIVKSRDSRIEQAWSQFQLAEHAAESDVPAIIEQGVPKYANAVGVKDPDDVRDGRSGYGPSKIHPAHLRHKALSQLRHVKSHGRTQLRSMLSF